MKFLAFILSIYIFTLNFAPCVDNCAPDNEIKTEISQAIDDDHQHQETDLCSPFCTCQCCQIHATYFEVVVYTANFTNIPTGIFRHINGLEKNFNPTILQPPQV